MTKKVLVTGATGTIGSQLVPQILGGGLTVRAMTRSEDKAQKLKEAGAEIAVAAFEDPASLDAAMAGVDLAVLITPPNEKAAEQVASLLDAAKKAGVTKLLRVSVIRASADGPTDNVRQHADSDQRVIDSGITYTILRPHFFMQNLFMSLQSIQQEGKMYWGMGEGRLAMIDARDIADVAAKVIRDNSHDGETLTLTGPASITFHHVAKAVSEASGKEVTYVPVPIEAVGEAIRSMGMGDWFAQVMMDYSRAYAAGWGDFVSEDTRKVLGKPARSIQDFAQEVLAPAVKAS